MLRPRILRFCVLLACSLLSCSPSTSETPQPVVSPPIVSETSPSADPVSDPSPIVFRCGDSFPEDASSIRVVLDADELELLDRFPALASADLTGSECAAEILAWAQAHPLVSVRYTVSLGDDVVSNDADHAAVERVSDASPLAYLPSLRQLTVSEPMEPDTVIALLAARPDLDLRCAVQVCGKTIPIDAEDLDASDLSRADADALAAAIPALPHLYRISLRGASDWTLDDADKLQRARDGLLVDYPTEAFGVSFSLADEVVSFSGVYLRERMDELRTLLPYLRNVKRLDMEECGVRDDVMAALRAEFPNPKIVWRIHARLYSCRTDAIMIKFSNDIDSNRLYDSDTAALKYCNEVQYLDLGHNHITRMDFLNYMPEIRVLIIAVGYVTNISGVENCKKLEYCEFLSGGIQDISPLAACTELRHLNLSFNLIQDITPLYGLKKLERLWISRNPIPEDQIETIKALLPDCTINTTAVNPTGEGWRYLEDGTIAPRYAQLRDEFCYGRHIDSYTEETRPAPIGN